MSKKWYYRYNKNLKKLFKPGKNRLFCHVSNDGSIYVSECHAIFKLTAEEYREFVQPATMCEPGHWEIDIEGRKRDIAPDSMDIIEMFNDAIELDRESLFKVPFTFDTETDSAAGFYCESFVTSANTKFCNVFSSSENRADNNYSAASDSSGIVVSWDEPFAYILPIRLHQNSAFARSIKAYFVDPAEDIDIKRENEQLSRVVSDQDTTIARLENRIAELEEALEAALAVPAPDAPADVTVETAAFLPSFRTFTTQTGPRTVSALHKKEVRL